MKLPGSLLSDLLGFLGLCVLCFAIVAASKLIHP